MNKTKVVKFDGNPLLGMGDCYQMLLDFMKEGDTLAEALEQVLLFEVKEQYLYHKFNGWREWECEWNLNNQATVTLKKL